MYSNAVFQEISEAHRAIGHQLYRHGIKNLVFLGGGEPGEPCLTEISGVDRRHRPPVVEFQARFPTLRSILAWNPSSEGFVLQKELRFSMDADGRPAQDTTVHVETDTADFTGIVHHIGAEWTVRWTSLFREASKPSAEQPELAAQTA